MLERRAVKVACVVLRGLGEGDLAWLPGDSGSVTLEKIECQRSNKTAHRLLPRASAGDPES
jgi:hypothetical protein